MVEFPGHIRLVASNPARKTAEVEKPSQSKAGQGANDPETTEKSTANLNQSGDMVNLVSQENRQASRVGDRPTLEEAEQALIDLEYDLSTTEQDLGEIHSNLDRRLILGLLAPLVTS